LLEDVHRAGSKGASELIDVSFGTNSALHTPGLYGDGGCLYLKVDGSGARRWILRTVVQGKRRDIGLGSATATSLAEARLKARTCRRTARAGGDPLTF
jgi:hypothetical protein